MFYVLCGANLEGNNSVYVGDMASMLNCGFKVEAMKVKLNAFEWPKSVFLML